MVPSIFTPSINPGWWTGVLLVRLWITGVAGWPARVNVSLSVIITGLHRITNTQHLQPVGPRLACAVWRDCFTLKRQETRKHYSFSCTSHSVVCNYESSSKKNKTKTTNRAVIKMYTFIHGFLIHHNYCCGIICANVIKRNIKMSKDDSYNRPILPHQKPPVSSHMAGGSSQHSESVHIAKQTPRALSHLILLHKTLL